MKSFKVLCTGNPLDRGIAMAVKKVFPDADFISRTNGFDLTFPNSGDEQRFRDKIKGYNVFINNAHIQRGTQEKLLRIVREHWSEAHVFSIGSLDEHNKWTGPDMEYANEKRQLREASLELGDESFKTTHIVVGGFQALTKGSDICMDPIHIAKTIEWILEADFEVPLIAIEKASLHIRKYHQTIIETGEHPPESQERWSE